MQLDRYKAVLFDLDGTLIESLHFFREAIDEYLRERSKQLDETFFWEWHAKRLPWESLLTHHCLSHDCVHEIHSESQSRFERIVHRSVEWTPGAQELVGAIRQCGIPVGVVSNASPSYIAGLNERLNLRAMFSVIVTSEDPGIAPKPDPSALLHACTKLSVHPSLCLYIGDQYFDVLAAYRAGMSSFLLQKEHTWLDFKEPTTVVRSFDEATELLFHRQ